MDLKTTRNVALLAIMCLCQCELIADEVNAEIRGPTKGQAGNQLILNSKLSNADSVRWIIPEEVRPYVMLCQDQIGFATRQAGVYTFHLVAAKLNDSNEIEMDVATHSVTVTDGLEAPPNEPPPSTDFESLRRLSRDAARKLQDPVTSTALANALAKVSSGSLVEMAARARESVEQVLLERKEYSKTKNWLDVWRKPINRALDGTENARVFELKLRAIVEGLRQANSEFQKLNHVLVHTREDCVWCTRWINEVEPRVRAMGFLIVHVHGDGEVPAFDVHVVGKQPVHMVGYQTASQFRELLQ